MLVLKGNVLFGGEILSYDFVEVLFFYCSGWDVLLLSDVEGSYEEVLSNIFDYVICDRCWV